MDSRGPIGQALAGVDHRNLLLNASLVVMSVCLVVAGLEVGLRVTDYGAGTESTVCYGESKQFQFHPTYGVTGAENSQYLKQFPGDEPEIYTHDDRGFRDTFDSGAKSIVMLGDSFTYGRLVNDTETFSYLIDRAAPNTSVRNYGIPGYSTKEELVVYRDVADRIDHDVVVLAFYLSNDMSGNVDDSPRRPQFEVTDGGVELTREPVNRTSTSASGFNVKRFLYRSSAAYAFLAPRIAVLLERAGLKESQTPPDGAELERQLAITRELLAEVGRVAGQQNADLLVMTIPESGDVNPQRPKLYHPDDGRPYWNAQRQMIANVAENNPNVDSLFLKPELKAALDRGNRVYGRANYHFDDHGHRVTARTLLADLREDGHVQNGTLPPSGASGPDRSTCP